MKAAKLIFSALVLLLPATRSHAGAQVDHLLREYSKIKTLTCRIRRTVNGSGGKIKHLSRIYYTSHGRLHVESLSPVRGRTIVDGTRLYQYIEGQPRGVSRLVGGLPDELQYALHKVPGTDHLQRLKGLKETALPEHKGLLRIGMHTDRSYAVLLLDSRHRLAGIRYYKAADLKVLMADYRYSDFQEVEPGVWIPFKHSAVLTSTGKKITEDVRLDRVIVNQPVAESLFDPAGFFEKDIAFSADAELFPFD
jgi:hypothetical protein